MRFDLGERDEIVHRKVLEKEHQTTTLRPGFQDRLLFGAAISLIALGERLKKISEVRFEASSQSGDGHADNP